MAKNLNEAHAKPCANCNHRDLHGEVSGCIANLADVGKPAQWCDCTAYVAPGAPKRDRVAGRAEGIALADQGADAALHGYAMNDGEWRTQAEERLDVLIARGTDFTAEDVTDVVGAAPSPNAIGGLFRGRKAEMEAVGFTTATRPEAHGRALRVWKGKA